MAQNKKSRKCEGLCQKIRNAVSPFKSRIRRNSHQPQPPISITTTDKIPHTPQTKPVHILHQSSSLGKTIPVEFNHFAAQNTKKTQSAGKENSSAKTEREFGEREILIVRDQMLAPRKMGVAPPAKVEDKPPPSSPPPSHGRLAKAGSNKDDETINDGEFSDYINKVKSRMMKTASNVGGGGGGDEKSLSLK